jgi:hypothetical protein
MQTSEDTHTIGGVSYRAVMDANDNFSVFRNGIYVGEITHYWSIRNDFAQWEVFDSKGMQIGSFYCDDNEGIYPDDAGCQILHEYAVNPPGSIPWTMDNK